MSTMVFLQLTILTKWIFSIKLLAFLAVFYFIAVFTLSNILMPLFYVIPQFKTLKKNGRIKSNPPFYIFIVPPIVHSVILGVTVIYVFNNFDSLYFHIALFLLLCSLYQALKTIYFKMDGIDDEFRAKYKKYLPDDL